ncbi:tumor necrosis factor receptor superfamily member 1B-like [Amblyraja radiata]|uniref:tumor necrosis factor receptor superfamily member 1B-like n=1 Tax=Amblyraja radiata TaxID=386614 RepID=UPI001402935F|nr:tumor necrosis factor receptor superfamily member 1B-like [Amblyraja radiata]
MIFQRLLYVFLMSLPGVAVQQDYSPPMKSASDCLNKTTEYFNKDLNLCCSNCQPGTRVAQYCTKEMDTQCKPCGDKQFTAYWHRMKKCKGCAAQCSDDQEQEQPCTLTTMRICRCRQGFHCIDLSDRTCNQCQKHHECKAGFGVIAQEDKDADVKCAPCASGTFSNSISSTEACKLHTECPALGRKILQEGTSEEDVVCSDELQPRSPTPRTIVATVAGGPPLPQVTSETTVEPINETLATGSGPPLHVPSRPWLLGIGFGILALIVLAVVATVCFLHKRKGRDPDPKDRVPLNNVAQVETICLISETEAKQLPGSRTWEQNGGVGSLGDHRSSLSRSSSEESRDARKNGLKEVDQLQTHDALLKNDSQGDCQEDQGYISRESRPSSGTPSPIMEFSGNPTVSVTINTGKCFVNCYHCQEDKSSGPGLDVDQSRAPEEEQGIEMDEGFPIQEEQRDSDSEKWKENGSSVVAVPQASWLDNSVPHQEEGKESHLPVQDTSGNVY